MLIDLMHSWTDTAAIINTYMQFEGRQSYNSKGISEMYVQLS